MEGACLGAIETPTLLPSTSISLESFAIRTNRRNSKAGRFYMEPRTKPRHSERTEKRNLPGTRLAWLELSSVTKECGSVPSCPLEE